MVSGGASGAGANERLASRMLLDFACRVIEHRAIETVSRSCRQANSGPFA